MVDRRTEGNPLDERIQPLETRTFRPRISANHPRASGAAASPIRCVEQPGACPGLNDDKRHGIHAERDGAATFGPRYLWSPAHHRCSFFGHALVGEANGFDSVFPGVGSATSSANSLALQVGGGLDLAIKHRLLLRAFEADWLRTELPNADTNVQNNIRLAAGVVVRFR
jgi:hypothetical protein